MRILREEGGIQLLLCAGLPVEGWNTAGWMGMFPSGKEGEKFYDLRSYMCIKHIQKLEETRGKGLLQDIILT